VPKVLIVYYTLYGNTEKAAQAICQGLREGGLNCDCKKVKDVSLGDVERYEVVLFGAPTHADGIPEEMRKFMDSLKRVKLREKMGAAFDTRYEDAEVGALTTLEKYMKQFGMNLVSPGLPVLLPVDAAKGPLLKDELNKCREYGKSIAQKFQYS